MSNPEDKVIDEIDELVNWQLAQGETGDDGLAALAVTAASFVEDAFARTRESIEEALATMARLMGIQDWQLPDDVFNAADWGDLVSTEDWAAICRGDE